MCTKRHRNQKSQVYESGETLKRSGKSSLIPPRIDIEEICDSTTWDGEGFSYFPSFSREKQQKYERRRWECFDINTCVCVVID